MHTMLTTMAETGSEPPESGASPTAAELPATVGKGWPLPEIDPRLYGDLPQFVFVWPTAADAIIAAGQVEADCTWYDRVDRSSMVRGRKAIVVQPEAKNAERRAQKAAQVSLDAGAESAWIWKLPCFGLDLPTMKEWTANFSLVRELSVQRGACYEGFVFFEGEPPEEGPEFLGDPRPIAAELLPVEPIDPQIIPEALRPWCEDITNRVGCPPEYVVAPLIVLLSGVIGRRIAIRPKRCDDWAVIPNLWGAVVGPPGSLKTPAIDEVCRPLKVLASDAMMRHEQRTGDARMKTLISAAKSSAARRALVKAAGKGVDDADLEGLAGQILGSPVRSGPGPKRYIVNDATVEKLGDLMAQPENSNGLTVFRDELVGLFRNLDQRGHESDRSFYLEAWNGAGSFTFDRIGRGTLHIPHACLSLFGGIQPGPLAAYLRASMSGEDCDGFIPRFQVMVYPDPHRDFINVDRWPDAEAKERAITVFRALDRLDPVARGCAIDGESDIPFLRFDDEAQSLFDEWRGELEYRLRSKSLSPLMSTHLSKYRSLMPSLALIFQLVESYEEPRFKPVSLQAAETAVSWCKRLEGHASRIYHATEEGDTNVAVRLAGQLKDSLPNPFTYRHVVKKGWSGLATVEEVRRAVGVLEDRNWVQAIEPAKMARGGRPTVSVWVHPKLRPGSVAG
jgi:hypothetical protein